jgi:hypothetical protein
MFQDKITLVDFLDKSSLDNWTVINDSVMGGKSKGSISITEAACLKFEGIISLQNNGGFSSVRYQFDKINIEKKNKLILYLQGDGKSYQFRLKPNIDNYYSYAYDFKTNGNWQKIEIMLNKMKARYRGRDIELGSFADNKIEEISFLIANKKDEAFKLLIRRIELE